jgi:hypothetical protein
MPPRIKPSPRVVPGLALSNGAGAPGAEQVHVDIRPAPPTPAQRAAWVRCGDCCPVGHCDRSTHMGTMTKKNPRNNRAQVGGTTWASRARWLAPATR